MSASAKIEVGSHIANIYFGGANVPLGFLVSFRDNRHFQCKAGKGFLERKAPGKTGKTGKVFVVCTCVVPRASKRLRQLGRVEFERLAARWLETEKTRIKAHEAICRAQGYEASADEACPYEEQTDQAIAWREGRASRLAANGDEA